MTDVTQSFFTKTWGFNPTEYPLVAFYALGHLTTLVKEYDAATDWIYIGGTKTKDTASTDQGRILGKVRVDPNVTLDTRESLEAIGTHIPQNQYKEDGSYKWPLSLLIVEAYAFTNPPLIADVFGTAVSDSIWSSSVRNLNKADGLTQSDIEYLDSLEVMPAKLPDSYTLRSRNKLKNHLNNTKGNSGPGPSSDRSAPNIKEGNPVTYWLKLKSPKFNQHIHKIGWTKDIQRRLGELNSGLIPSITGYRWEEYKSQPQVTEDQAFQCEQLIRRQLLPYLVEGETEIFSCTERVFNDAWIRVISEGKYIDEP